MFANDGTEVVVFRFDVEILKVYFFFPQLCEGHIICIFQKYYNIQLQVNIATSNFQFIYTNVYKCIYSTHVTEDMYK